MNSQTSLSLFVMVLAAIGMFLLIIFIPTSAGAVECRSRPGDTRASHWMWRSIDSKKCWYPGRRVLPKSSLHWSDGSEKKQMDPKLPARQAAPAYRAEFNEIDRTMPGDKTYSGPIIMFPELADKLDALKNWWDNRWKPSP